MKELIIERIKETKPGETICLNHEECKEVIRMISGGLHDAKKEPPIEEGDYLVLFDDNTVDIMYYKNGKFRESATTYFEDDERSIAYWMEIPELPKEGEA